MELEDYHRALLALCFGEAGPSELRELALYRELVRGRFLTMAKVAFKRSFATIGEPLEASFARYLAASPPRSPFIRDVIAGFQRHAESELGGLLSAPAHARDLLRFEAAKWEVANAADESVAEIDEVDFDRVLVLNPTLRVLQLEHGVVDRAGREQTSPTFAPNVLLVYRRPGEDDVRWYRCDGLFARVLCSPLLASAPLGALVRDAARAETVDEAALDELARALSVAVTRGVVLGSRQLD